MPDATATPDAPTASTFREPLLRALGKLTGLQPAVSVLMTEALDAVYKETGYTEDQFGIDEPSNAPRLRLVIQQAFNKNLRPNGLGDSQERGRWALTDEGVKIASVLLNGAANDPILVAVPAYDGGGGVSWSLGRQVNSYSDDPYIQGVAIALTSCFGEFSSRSDVCAVCSISGACKAAVLARLSALATTLLARDAENRRKAEEAARKAAEPPLPPPPPSSPHDLDIQEILAAIENETGTADVGPGTEIDVTASSKCSECKGKIDKDSKAMYIEGRGVYHHACYEKVKKT